MRKRLTKVFDKAPAYSPARAKSIMQALLMAGEAIDRRTGEVNLTELAEQAADELKGWAWLDDELHPIWGDAIKVSDWWERKRR